MQPDKIKCYVFFLTSLAYQFAIATPTLQPSIDIQTGIQKNAIKSQKKVDKISDKTAALLSQYQHVMDQVQNLRVYNQQLEKLVQSQNQEKQGKQKQLQGIEGTEQAIVPLMLKMIEVLESFVRLDLPFLLEKRLDRITTLHQLMDKADVTTSEKYHQILETFLLEIEYGQTVAVYLGKPSNGEQSQVKFLRVGRLALYYQTLDSRASYYWSSEAKQFQVLPEKYWHALDRGFRVAQKQTAPEFLKLPIKTPVRYE